MSKTDVNEILKKGSIALIIRVIGFLSGYLFIFITVKHFGAAVQGRLSLCFSFMIIGSLFCRSGVDVNYVKIFAINNNFDNSKGLFFKVLPIAFLVSFIISSVIYFSSSYISEVFFDDPLLTPFLKWTAPCIMFFTILLINAGALRGLRKNSIYAFLFNGGRFLFTLLFFLILFYTTIRNEIIVAMAHTFGIITLFMVSLFYVRRHILPYSRITNYKVNVFLKDSLPMFFSASLIVLLGWTDTIILGIYRDSASVGKYHVILKIATVISFTLQAVDSILAPKLSRAFHDKDMTLFKKLVKVATIINSLISIILFLGIVFFQDFILGIFGKEFLLVSLPLLILCIGQLINSIFGPIGSIFQMTGNQKIFQNILLISFGINLTLNLLLAPKYGIKGVAIATAFSLITSKILGVIFIKNRIWNKSVEG